MEEGDAGGSRDEGARGHKTKWECWRSRSQTGGGCWKLRENGKRCWRSRNEDVLEVTGPSGSIRYCWIKKGSVGGHRARILVGDTEIRNNGCWTSQRSRISRAESNSL